LTTKDTKAAKVAESDARISDRASRKAQAFIRGPDFARANLTPFVSFVSFVVKLPFTSHADRRGSLGFGVHIAVFVV